MFLLFYVCFLNGLKFFPCHKGDALTMAKKLLENVFPTWDIPSTVSSDRGTHFIGQIIGTLTKIFQISWNYHSSYHPPLSGKVEKTNEKLDLSRRNIKLRGTT